MSITIYRVLRHNGGWAYRAAEAFSDTFETREAARAAARVAAREHRAPKERAATDEEKKEHGHRESVDGNERRGVTVRG
jgi:hypothetical protein